MTDARLGSWEAAIARFDEQLRPIAKRPVDLRDRQWMTRLTTRRPPLDEAGIRPEVEALLEEIVPQYPQLDEAARQRVRDLFRTYQSFAWAAGLGYRPTDGQSFRKHLLLVAINDQGRDPRDAIMWLDQLCREARAAGMDPRPLLEEVAPVASATDRWGFGSMRELMLAAARRWGLR
jgi:hypothetical protein